jgi:hypothetical protein
MGSIKELHSKRFKNNRLQRFVTFLPIRLIVSLTGLHSYATVTILSEYPIIFFNLLNDGQGKKYGNPHRMRETFSILNSP